MRDTSGETSLFPTRGLPLPVPIAVALTALPSRANSGLATSATLAQCGLCRQSLRKCRRHSMQRPQWMLFGWMLDLRSFPLTAGV
jgi:hypothetical protein